MRLFCEDLHAYLHEHGFAHLAYTLFALRECGLTWDLAWRVLFAETLPVALSAELQAALNRRSRSSLARQLATLRTALGVRLPRLLTLAAPDARLTKPLLVWRIVRGLIVGPETDEDRAAETRRLWATVNSSLEAAKEKRFRCVICRREHGRRALARCLSRRMDEIRGVGAPARYGSRMEVVRALREVD